MAIKRHATAVWKGAGQKGSGTIDSQSKFFDKTPYSFKTRFENEDGKLGTNPDELIAAAHASCYAMALSVAISEEGHTAEELTTKAVVTVDTSGDGAEISGIALQLEGKVPGMSEEKFMELANGAKDGCPVSKALSAVPITLDAKFVA